MRSHWAEAMQGVRPVVRGSRAGRLLLVVIIALTSGALMASVAGARRTLTSYDRLVSWTDAPDVTMGGGAAEEVERLPDALADSDAVERFTTSYLVNGAVRLPDGSVLSLPDIIPVTVPDWHDRVKVLRGELPDVDSPNDALVPLVTSERLGLEPGDQLTLIADDGSEIAINVAAVVAIPSEFPSVGGRVFSTVGLGPAFATAYPQTLNREDASINVWLVNGSDSLDTFRAEGERLGFTSIDVEEQVEVTKGVNRLVRIEAIALLAAGLVAAVAGAVVILQLMRRTADGAATSLRTLQALGVTRSGFGLGGALSGFAVGLTGALVGAALAVLSSASTPFGTARIAEPEPGVRIDPVVLALVIVTTVLITTAAGAWVAGRSTRRSPTTRRTVRPSLAAIPEPIGSGVRFALSPAASEATDRGRTSLLGLGFVVAALIAVIGTGLALSSVRDDPRLSGGWWDGWIGIFGADPEEALSTALATSPEVASFVVGGWLGESPIGGVPVGLMATDPDGDLQPPMTRGRAPRGPDEVALGHTVVERLGLDIGDEITFEVDDDEANAVTVTLEVVGETVFAAPQWFTMAPGEGALVDTSFVDRWQPGSAGQPYYLVRLRDGVDAPSAMQSLASTIPQLSDGEPAEVIQFARSPRSDIEALTGIIKIPAFLALELIVVAVATLAHEVVTSDRRHRRDLAVLRSLGLTARQSTGVSVAQAGTFGLVALAVGLPLGLAIGFIAWKRVAQELVVIPRFPISGLMLLAVVVGILGLALVLGLMVGRSGRRRPAAADLRRE